MLKLERVIDEATFVACVRASVRMRGISMVCVYRYWLLAIGICDRAQATEYSYT